MYIKKDLMLLDDSVYEWQIKEYGFNPMGLGDAGWRTALANMAYKDKDFRDGTLKMLAERKRYLGENHTEYHDQKEEYSRDHLIMEMVSFELTGESIHKLLKIPFRLSKKTFMTPELYFWVRYIQKGGRLNKLMFIILNIIEMHIANILDSIIYNKLNKIFKTEPCSIDKYINISYLESGRSDVIKWKKIREKLYPMYSRHLKSWMLYCVGKNKTLSKLIMKNVSKDNLLIRILNHERIGEFNILHRTGYIWQSRIETITCEDLHVVKSEQYNLDIDILNFAINDRAKRF